MFERFGRKSMQATAAAMITALGVAGYAAAQGQGTAATTKNKPAVTKAHPRDPAGPNDKADSQKDPAEARDKADAHDKGDANDKADERGTESGSEVAGNDGPGGHADEPGNPNANTQQRGAH